MAFGHTQPQPLMAAVEANRIESASTPQYLSKDIRDLHVMQDRVLADNPLEDETESPLGEIVPVEWRVVRREHTEPNGTRHIIELGIPLYELTTVTARPSSSIGDFEVDDHWQPGDPLPEDFDESVFPIDPSVVAAMLAEQSAASDDAVAGLPTEPLTVGSTIFVDLPEHGRDTKPRQKLRTKKSRSTVASVPFAVVPGCDFACSACGSACR